MRLSTVFVSLVAAATAALWVDRASRNRMSRRLQTSRVHPAAIDQWEGEGGALPVSGAHFSPPVEPAIRPEGVDPISHSAPATS